MEGLLKAFVVCGISLFLVLAAYVTWINPPPKWNEPKDMAFIQSLYAENNQEWAQKIANAPREEDGTGKFVILKFLNMTEDGSAEFIVYDDSDNIADIRRIPISYYRAAERLHYGLVGQIGVTVAKKIVGHYYWIRQIVMNNGYAFDMSHRDEFRIIQFNCSVFEIPTIHVCPDQLRYSKEGQLELEHQYHSKQEK